MPNTSVVDAAAGAARPRWLLRLFVLPLLASLAWAQTQPPCMGSVPVVALPSISAILDVFGVVHFQCGNLGYAPLYSAVSCPQPVTIPVSALPGTPIYFGLTFGGLLHVSDGCGAPAGCAGYCNGAMGCYQDSFAAPGIGETPIAVYTVGSTVKQMWAGSPAIPQVQVMGCDVNGYTVSYGPATITVNCK